MKATITLTVEVETTQFTKNGVDNLRELVEFNKMILQDYNGTEYNAKVVNTHIEYGTNTL